MRYKHTRSNEIEENRVIYKVIAVAFGRLARAEIHSVRLCYLSNLLWCAGEPDKARMKF